MDLRSVVLWTGGKDSALALHGATAAGCVVDRLVTFAPPSPEFLAHPLPVMRAQAEALGLAHEVVTITGDAAAGYRAAFERLRAEGIAALVTGDIDLVDGLPNFVRQCSEGLDLEVLMPLWHAERPALMARLLEQGYEVILSLVKQPWLSADWVGRRLDAAALAELAALHEQNGVDVCGENGEFHTLVLDGPGFGRRVGLSLGPPRTRDEMSFLTVLDVHLAPR